MAPLAHASGFGEQPMTASAVELRRAGAGARPDKKAGTARLLDEVIFRVEPNGTTTARYRSIVAIETAEGAEAWQTLTVWWSPWFQDTPVVDARVLDRSGQFHRLDPRTVAFGGGPTADSHVVGDLRLLRASLPAVASGAIAEVVMTMREHRPSFSGGGVFRTTIGHATDEVTQSRVVIDSPAAMPLSIDEDLRGIATRRVEQAAGRKRRIYEAGALLPIPRPPYKTPGDHAVLPSVGFSTGSDWARVARDYGSLVRRQIAAGPLPAEVQVQRGGTRRQTIARAVDLVHRDLRPTGVGLGQNEIGPWTPAEVWQHRYGDCEDLATFLVALLARAGIEAHVALVNRGSDEDIRARLPGVSEFDHVIVYVPGEKLWIDPTIAVARPGQLSPDLEGRWALQAAPSTRNLLRTATSRAADNHIAVNVAATMLDVGSASLVHTARFAGTPEIATRMHHRRTDPAAVARYFEDFVETSYRAQRFVRHRVTRADDLSTPFTIEVAADRARTFHALEEGATVNVGVDALFELLPADLRQPAEKTGGVDAAHHRPQHPRLLVPHVVEWHYAIHVPEGFEPIALPAANQTFGPASYSHRFEMKGRELRGEMRFTLSRGRVEPHELEAMTRGVRSLLASPRLWIRFEHRTSRMWRAGDVAGALKEARKLLDREPRNAGRSIRLSLLLANAGLMTEAEAAARRAVEAAPSLPQARGIMAVVLRRDQIGRWDVPGFHRRSTIAELERAAALEPKNTFYPREMGVLLAMGDDSSYLGGDLKRAGQALVRARELGRTELERPLLDVLLGAGDTATLAKLAEEIEDLDWKAAFRLAAARDDAAFGRALGQIPESARQRALHRYFVASLQVGDHDRLRRMIRVKGADTPATRAHRDLIGRLRRVSGEPKTPAELLALWASNTVFEDGKRWMSRDRRQTEGAGPAGGANLRLGHFPLLDVEGVRVTPRIVADHVLGTLRDVRSLGRAGPVERYDVGAPGPAPGPAPRLTFYVVREDGERMRLITTGMAPQFLAPAILRAADAGRLDDARHLLDWAFADADAAKGAIRVNARFWTGGQRGDLRRIRLAAAALLARFDQVRGLALLDGECPRARDLDDPCRRVRSESLSALGRYREALQAIKALPIGTDADLLAARAWLLGRSRAWSELERLAAGSMPDGATTRVQEVLAASWIARGQPERARAILDSIRASEAGKSRRWRNSTSWMYLFVGRDLAPVIAELEQAIAKESPSAASLHTLAVCYAGAGRHRDALDAIRRAVSARGRIDPIDHIVAGRIAAAAGMTAAARRAYGVVISGEKDDTSVTSTAALARRWLAELPR